MKLKIILFLLFSVAALVAYADPTSTTSQTSTASTTSQTNTTNQTGQTSTADLLAKRDDLCEQIELLVGAIEESGIDFESVGFEEYRGLYERGKSAIAKICDECISLEQQIAMLQKELASLLKMEKMLFDKFEKLEEVVDEVVKLKADKLEKETKYFRIDKGVLVVGFCVGGMALSGLVLFFLLRQ